MRMAVIGSREFADRAAVFARVYRATLGARSRNLPVIISGGARGVDTWARDAAALYELTFEEYPADWGGLGRRAGYERNRHLVELADLVIAFWDGESRGTRHTINLALMLHRPLEVHFARPKEQGEDGHA